jgi:hypothetical protein
VFKDRVPKRIQRMTRVDREDESSLTDADQDYVYEYLQREQLLVITPRMVDAYLREIMTDEDYDIVSADLSKYPSKW